MTKPNPKLIAAAILLAAALGLYFYNTRDEPVPDNDDTLTRWYCTKSAKNFTLSGPEYEANVKLRRKATPGDENNPGAFRTRDVMEPVALSPFSNEYTGVEAIKCPKCSEVFPLRNEKGEENKCPKCGWNPLAIEESPPPEPAPPP